MLSVFHKKRFNKIVLCTLIFVSIFALSACDSVDPDQDVSRTQIVVPLNPSDSSSEITVESSDVTSSEAPVSGSVYDWNLILVNFYNELPEGFEVEFGQIGTRKMDERIVAAVEKMFLDAKNDGVDLMIASAYRSVERQTELFEAQIQNYLDLGYSEADAYNAAKEWVAPPNTSEHHTGLALDIVTPTYQVLDYNFDTTDAFEWLSTHCTDYGFILRYTREKSHITGITYEPWHYRYVGVEAAKYITENGICLEEYLEELSQ